MLTELMTKLGRIQFMVLSLILSGFIIFGKSFISLWVGEKYAISYYVILLLMIPVTIPEVQKIGLEILKAKNMHKFRSIVYAIIAIVNVGISIPLSIKWGAIGAAVGTAVTVIIGNGFVMNWYYHRRARINMKFFWKNLIIIFSTIVPVACISYVVIYLISPTKWSLFFISVAIYSIIYVMALFIFAMNKYEKDLIMGIVGKINSR